MVTCWDHELSCLLKTSPSKGLRGISHALPTRTPVSILGYDAHVMANSAIPELQYRHPFFQRDGQLSDTRATVSSPLPPT